ncbi:WD40-repeat-containing domain protein [Dipodascopsis tothii]|uniref:WD40-repeat-containing domain protein n=1 Tax=Dipodascopsis tothii TaxID=44089 RepID=UPI0034D00320
MNVLSTGHQDLIHEVAYDQSGTRIATCSSDHHIKVFELDADGQWALAQSWKAHEGTIHSVRWAPPQYGQVLASCSEDRTMRIFQEQPARARGPRRAAAFERITTFSDATGTVNAIAFASAAPHGLRLACIGSDCTVRVYTAPDPTDLRHWTLVFQSALPVGGGGAALARGVRDFQSDYAVDWCSTAAAALDDGRQVPLEQFVVSAKDRVFVFRRSESTDEDAYYGRAEELAGHGGTVHDVSWARGAAPPREALPPAVTAADADERVATACKDGRVRIYVLARRPGPAVAYDVRLAEEFADHGHEVWKVSWNATGTILSSSGDDGKTRLWKQTYTGAYQCMGVISAEQASVNATE